VTIACVWEEYRHSAVVKYPVRLLLLTGRLQNICKPRYAENHVFRPWIADEQIGFAKPFKDGGVRIDLLIHVRRLIITEPVFDIISWRITLWEKNLSDCLILFCN
jgi:hypothetical protein